MFLYSFWHITAIMIITTNSSTKIKAMFRARKDASLFLFRSEINLSEIAALSSNYLICAWYCVMEGILESADRAISPTSYVRLVTYTDIFCNASIASNPSLCRHIIAVV